MASLEEMLYKQSAIMHEALHTFSHCKMFVSGLWSDTPGRKECLDRLDKFERSFMEAIKIKENDNA